MKLKDFKLKIGMSKEEVNEKIGEYVELVDDIYLGVDEKHNWKCNECGNEFIRSFQNIKYYNAADCGCLKYKLEEEKYKKLIESEIGYKYIRSYRNGEILPDGRINGNRVYLEIKHDYCGNIYLTRIDGFKKGKRCGNCCQSYEKSFAHHIEVELGEPLEKYWDFDKNIVNPYFISKHGNVKIWIMCTEDFKRHGSYKTNTSNVIRGGRCSKCKTYKGESIILNYLIDNKIKYKFNTCCFDDLIGIGGGRLRPDFILPDNKIWIEYDGEFHYKDMYKDGSYENQIENDNIKNDYAKEHGWKMIRIPYTEIKNIKKILDELLTNK